MFPILGFILDYNNATEGNVILHRKIRNYLGTEIDISIDYYCYYTNNKNSSTSLQNNDNTPVNMQTIDNTNNDNNPDEEDRQAIDPLSQDPITQALPVDTLHPPKRGRSETLAKTSTRSWHANFQGNFMSLKIIRSVSGTRTRI